MSNQFDKIVTEVLKVSEADNRILAVCAAGSWITNEIDEYSDLDLVFIVKDGIVFTKDDMILFASKIGSLVVSFTGEHIGENRLLICLFDDPVLHVDLKFVQKTDFMKRVENPKIIWEREKTATEIYSISFPKWPKPEFQWIEDHFWIWIHYAATKLGRGELMETIEFLSAIRNMVIGPLYHMKYGKNPRGVRKLEFILNPEELESLRKTIPEYSFSSIKNAIYQAIYVYREQRTLLYKEDVVFRTKAENLSMEYLDRIKVSHL